jgi:nicotinate phosphoribosyltransferase
MFFRRQPFGGGFTVFAGLEELINRLTHLRFTDSDIAYLEGQGTIKPDFLEYLSRFRFTGSLWAMDEGSLIFPGEPVLRVHAGLIEAQLIESLLLNAVNFATLIATKAARIYNTARGGKVLEFGLRRAQGVDGALSAARAAFVGGVTATSNTLAGKNYGIPVSGTMAHSWVMSFDDELEAFRSYAELYPDNTVLLIDTYDTLGSGIENAVIVGKELKAKGRNFGIRLDSGDLQYLSDKVRSRLDKEGLTEAFIVVSNDLDEEVIHQLVSDGAPIDLWGVGTQLVTGGSDSSLTGVYKLVAREADGVFQPVIKVSDNPEKTTNPGIKQVYRFYGEGDTLLGDLLCLADEAPPSSPPVRFNHPLHQHRFFHLENYARMEAMLRCRIESGVFVEEHPPLEVLRENVVEHISRLDSSYKRLINPHIYKVSLSDKLWKMKSRMIERLTGGDTGLQP